MSEPRRLLEGDASDFEKLMLSSACREHASPASLEKTLAAMGVGGAIITTVSAASAATSVSAASAATSVSAASAATSVSAVAQTVSAGSASVAASGLGVLSLAKWVGLGLIAGTAVVATVELRSSPPQHSIAPAAIPSIAIASPRRPMNPAVSLLPSAVEVLPHASTLPPPAVLQRAADPSSASSEPVTPSEPVASAAAPSVSLGDEVRAIEAIRSTLARGDGPGALAALAEFDRRFPRASLGHEAVMLRIQALMASGQRASALDLARTLLSNNPQSPHAPQLRQWFPELTNL